MQNKHIAIFVFLSVFTAVISAFVMSVQTPATAQAVQRTTPQTQTKMQLSFAPLVKKTAPAVVNIYARRVVKTQGRGFNPLFNDPFFQQFFGPNVFGTMPRQRVENSLGSGVIVQPNGLIVSNAHVVNHATEIVVVLADGREFEAESVLIDERTDLAVIRVKDNMDDLPFIDFSDSDTLEVGDLVLAIGNPFGVGQTVTSGIVSAVARTDVGISDYNFFIQTDAAINPGNSGGALVDMAGNLAGINTAIFSRDGGSLGIGFAIPANMVRVIVEAAKAGGKVQRPWFGASAQRLTSDIARSMGLPGTKGALITEIHPDGPAAKAGLQTGDVVLRMNDKIINEPRGLRFRLATLPLGDTVRMQVRRGDKDMVLSMRTAPPPEIPPRNETTLNGRHPFSGVTVSNINPVVVEEIGPLSQTKGVIATQVRTASPLSIRKGDIIYTVNSVVVENVKQLEALLGKRQKFWRVELLRGGQMISVMVSG